MIGIRFVGITLLLTFSWFTAFAASNPIAWSLSPTTSFSTASVGNSSSVTYYPES